MTVPLQSYRAVVFDLDGTLADTAGDLTAALNHALGDLNLRPVSERDVRGMIGEGLRTLLDRGLAHRGADLDATLKETALTRLIAHYAAAPCVHAVLYPGARDCLDALQRCGIVCGVLTNKDDAIAKGVLEGLGIAPAFRAALGSGAGFPRKPDPSGLLHLLEAMDATPETTLLVGDSVTDLRTARAAGVRAVLVRHGYSVTPVTDLGADWVINHLHELVQGLALQPRAQ